MNGVVNDSDGAPFAKLRGLTRAAGACIYSYMSLPVGQSQPLGHCFLWNVPMFLHKSLPEGTDFRAYE